MNAAFREVLHGIVLRAQTYPDKFPSKYPLGEGSRP
jgi:hypothetical protein